MTKQSLSKPVEWAYCFDVHLNAFVTVAFAVYGVQLLLWPCKLRGFYFILYFLAGVCFIVVFLPLPVLSRDNIVSVLFGNSLWVLALTYYIYITFLGYTGVLRTLFNPSLLV